MSIFESQIIVNEFIANLPRIPEDQLIPTLKKYFANGNMNKRGEIPIEELSNNCNNISEKIHRIDVGCFTSTVRTHKFYKVPKDFEKFIKEMATVGIMIKCNNMNEVRYITFEIKKDMIECHINNF